MNSSDGPLAAASAQETASADLVLLQQNLGKSRRVTARMAGLLTSFDDRLARLEKNVVPIHRSTKDLGKLQRNIEAALLAIDAVVGTNDLVDREEEILRRDAKDDIAAYQASLRRLKKAKESMESAAATGSMNPTAENNKASTLGRIRSLIDTGCRKLGDAMLDNVQSVSPKRGWPEIDGWDERSPFPALMPTAVIDSSVAILSFIQTILGSGSAYDREIQQTYGNIRGVFMAATLNQVGREAVEGIEVQTRAANTAAGKLPNLGRRGFGRFLDTMFAMLKAEHGLAGSIFGKSLAGQVYRHIVPALLTILNAIGTTINGIVRKTLTTNAASVGIALILFAEMTEPSRLDVFEDWVRVKASRKDNELLQLSHAFKGSCMRSLPEVMEDARGFGNKQLLPHEMTQSSVNPVTVTVVNFAKQIAEFPDVVESFLHALGDGKWLPIGVASKAGPLNPRDLETGALTLVPRYLTDVIHILLTALDARAGAMTGRGNLGVSQVRRDHNVPPAGRQAAGIAAIFMLNNISFIRREVMMNSNIPDLLSGGSAVSRRDSSSTATGGGYGNSGGGDTSTEDELNKRNRSAKSSYLEIFSPLVSCLMDAGVEHSKLKSAVGIGNTEKQDVKDRYIRFNDALDEIENIHRVARLDKNEDALRERVKDEVIRMCVPTYAAFIKRHENFSKNPSKYLKMDGAGLQAKLESFFVTSKLL